MKNKKLIVLCGISNSGKSTIGKKLWEENPLTTVIVNRDKIRELLFSYTEINVEDYYNRDDHYKLEKIVTRYEDTLINEGLEADKTVIVDATNLRRKSLNRFNYWNVETEIIFCDISLKEADIRNESRNRKVPKKVIQKQYNRYTQLRKDLEINPIDFSKVIIEKNKSNPPCFIFDIDGTLAHMDRDKRSPYDWKKVGLDTVDNPTTLIADIINSNEYNPKLIICTGRDGICLEETTDWLKKHHIEYSKLYIREAGDQRPDWVIKEEMWREISKEYNILGMFDDRLQVVRRARALGLKVFNVEYNNF